MSLKQLSDQVKKVAKTLALDALKGQLSFLSWPILGPAAILLISKLIDIILEALDNEGFLLYVSYQSAKQADDFTKESEKNLEVLKNGTQDEKNQARVDLINAARKLVRFDGLP